jgi:NADH-quinone oxidoreductase subunit N
MMPNLEPAFAEIFLAVGICVVLITDLFLPQSRRDITYVLALLCLAGTAWASFAIELDTVPMVIFTGNFIADPLSQFLKIFTIATVGVAFVYSRGYLLARELYKGEYYVLGLFALLGIMVMISAFSLLTMYLGLEMLSLALYAMVAFDRESPIAAEAAMKYFVLGAIASGILLYGMSIIYGVTGSLRLDQLASTLLASESGQWSVLLGVAFILVGVAFKFGAVPFHMWLPDVYQGAVTSVTLFIGTAPKIAALAMAIRLLVEGLGAEALVWQPMLIVLAVLSLAVGNILAIAQTNIKRMLGYSAISNAGFILLGLVAGDQVGREAALFYTLIYVITAAGAFGMVILMSRGGFEADQLDHYKGLNARSPWFAAIMLLLMLSLIGVPPLAGFFAKWSILAALIGADKTWLAALGVLFSVIGAFYYLRVVRLMYFDTGLDQIAPEAGLDLRVLLSLNGLVLLGLGLFPNWLLRICIAVMA